MALTIRELMEIQTALQEKYRGIWEGDSPETAKHHLLYAVEEIGEVSAILKKRSAQAVVRDETVRTRFCEEMADVFMYLTDVLLCCGVTAEEFESAYRAKAERNLRRDFPKEHQAYLDPFGATGENE
ncbi:MAG: nucleotide pyrophosphohydrolase [Clostridia bacterium]|jgi:NTP pyrophosphatase (non-canonical NTP hydrolase)|nr:nucleotide pyrophosphohydrolase [Clostridia bacterium]